MEKAQLRNRDARGGISTSSVYPEFSIKIVYAIFPCLCVYIWSVRLHMLLSTKATLAPPAYIYVRINFMGRIR